MTHFKRCTSKIQNNVYGSIKYLAIKRQPVHSQKNTLISKTLKKKIAVFEGYH